jgi:hypothetical protein
MVGSFSYEMADGSHGAPDGLPTTGKGRLPAANRSQRIAFSIVGFLTVWLAVALCWCLFRLPAAGHDNISASRTIIAENMGGWGIWGPVREYFLVKPGPDQYYVHHPLASFWTIRVATAFLGAKPWVTRVPSILMTLAVPPMLFGIGRRMWGLWPGVLCAAGYVALPITLAFGDFPGFEVPLIFGIVLTTWAYVRMSESWNVRARRWGALSLLGVAYAINVDWEALPFLLVVLGALAAAAWFIPQRVFGPVNPRRFGGWWALAGAITVVTVFGYFLYLQRIGMLQEMLSQEGKRSRGNDAELAEVLRGDVRSYWIDLMFTPVAVTVGKIAAPLLVLRVIFLRRIREVFPLAILVMSVVWYVKFKNGADVHIYWPQPFAAYYALAIGALAVSLVGFVRWVLRLFRRVDRRGLVPMIVYGLAALSIVVMVPDSLRALRYGRASGARFNEKGRHSWREMDKVVALQWMARDLAPATVVVMHTGLRSSWACEWAVHHPVVSQGGIPQQGKQNELRYFMADLTQMNTNEQEKMFATFHVIVVGSYTKVDREAEHAPLDAYAIDEREPTFFEWYSQYAVDPVRTIRRDPWETWELRNDFSQSPNPLPADEPASMEELRVAHNAAVAAGDADRAQKYRQRLVSQLDVQVATKYTDGTELLGQRYTRGVEPKLSLYFLAAGPSPDELQFDMSSEVEASPLLSLVQPDPLVKAVGTPFAEPPHTWRKGYIYVDRAEVRHRPGRETFYGQFMSLDHRPVPKRVDRAEDTWLLTLE